MQSNPANGHNDRVKHRRGTSMLKVQVASSFQIQRSLLPDLQGRLYAALAQEASAQRQSTLRGKLSSQDEDANQARQDGDPHDMRAMRSIQAGAASSRL